MVVAAIWYSIPPEVAGWLILNLPRARNGIMLLSRWNVVGTRPIERGRLKGGHVSTTTKAMPTIVS